MSRFKIPQVLFLSVLASLPLCKATQEAGGFTLIVLPDTQYYSESYPQHFMAQTQWIKDNAAALNIKYVLHLGDLTEHNATNEWNVAKAAMDTLNGVVPYALAAGNHDYTFDYRVDNPRSARKHSTMFLNSDRDVPPCFGTGTPYALQPSLGGFYIESGGTIRTDNSWHVFEAMGEKFLVLVLEWGPRDRVVEWADAMVRNHPNHHAILITHAYMNHDETRFDWMVKGAAQPDNPYAYNVASQPGGTNDGEELWQKLVRKHPNFIMVINGHVGGDGTALLTSTGDQGNKVHQMLCNYQMLKEGGMGWLRIYTFKADKKTVEVKTYSPVLDEYNTSPDQQFTLELSPGLQSRDRSGKKDMTCASTALNPSDAQTRRGAVAKTLFEEDFESIPVEARGYSYVNTLGKKGAVGWNAEKGAFVCERHGANNPAYPIAGHSGDKWAALNGDAIYRALPETYVPGRIYRLSFWSMAITENQAMYVFFTDGDGNRGYHIGADGKTNKHRLRSAFVEVPVESDLETWHQYAVMYTPSAVDGGKKIGITIYGRKGVMIDDIVVESVGETGNNPKNAQ